MVVTMDLVIRIYTAMKGPVRIDAPGMYMTGRETIIGTSRALAGELKTKRRPSVIKIESKISSALAKNPTKMRQFIRKSGKANLITQAKPRFLQFIRKNKH